MTRPIPTVQASPSLLQEGDMVHPDIAFRGNPFRLVAKPRRVKTSNGTMGWQLDLEGHGVLLVRDHVKVRTQRRPQPQPAPRAQSEEEWEPDTVRRRVPERRPA
jgi:hypothetical protein